MQYPSFKEEKKLWKQGFNFVAGLDEAGRGPLAGPVVAAAVMVKLAPATQKYNNIIYNVIMLSGLAKIRDSKKLSAKQRDFFYEILTHHNDIQWGIGTVSEKVIDKINILEATKLAMQKAVDNLGANADFLLLDGNFSIRSNVKQRSIIKGDQKVFSISAASIITKVTRDRIMQKMHKKYPQYGFDAHKGYGTVLHIKNLKNFGPCKIHRKTFWPVSGIAKKAVI